MELLWLKIAAYFTMLVDHAGLVLFQNERALRVVGRIAFPIFALMASEGARKSSDVRKYMLRLFLCGIASEIPFNLMLSGRVFYIERQNVCFTLLLGVLASVIYLRLTARREWYLKLAGVFGSLVPVALAALFAVDYGAEGAALVLLFAAARGSKPLQAFVLVFINTWLCLPARLDGLEYVWGYVWRNTQMFGLMALPFVLLYNGEKRGRGGTVLGRYGFYLFYPLHMLALWAVGLLV